MTAPARPVVTASDGTSSDSVRITWGNSARALSYSIKRAESTTGNKTLLDSNAVSPYVDNDVVPGKTYYYWVTAVNEVGSTESSYDSGYRAISLSLDATGNVYTKDGGEASFSVSGNSSWTVTCAYDWISLITTSGNGTGIVSFILDKNYDGEARYGTIVVTSGSVSKTITVTQPGRVLVAVNSGTVTINTGASSPSFNVSSSGKTYYGKVVDGTAVYSFDYLEIGSSVSVSISGSRPLVIESETDMKIACDLDVSGTSAGRCGGGIGGAGGSGGSSVTGGAGGSGGSYGYGGSGYTVNYYAGTTQGQSGSSGSAGSTGYGGSAGKSGTSGSSGGKGFGSTGSAASGGSRGTGGTGGSAASSVGRAGSGGYAGSEGNAGGSGTKGGAGTAGNNGSSGSNGVNAFTTALTTDVIIAGSGGGGGGGGGSGGSGGGGSGGGGGGGGGGTTEAQARAYSSNTVYINRKQYQGAMGGFGGVGGSGGKGASSGAGGSGGAGGHGGGAVVLRAAGVLQLSGCVDVSAANGSRNGSSGSSASSAASGGFGNSGSLGQGAMNTSTFSTLSPSSGCRGGAGGAGGAGGNGGKGGSGGTGGYGSPGMVKLYASVLLASNGSIAGANGDNSTTASRCGGLSLGTNMKPTALTSQKPTVPTTIKCGEMGGAVSSKTASVYDESVMVPVVGQLKTLHADVAGICETGNYALSQVSSIAAEGSVEGLTVKRLTTLFDGYDQIFLINSSSEKVGPVEIKINDVVCELPELASGEAWTTCVLTGVMVTGNEVVPPTFTVNFVSNGGTLSGETIRSIVSGLAIGALPTPIRDGYTFLGWFTAAEGGAQVTADTVVTGDMTLYAQWGRSNSEATITSVTISRRWPWNGKVDIDYTLTTAPEGTKASISVSGHDGVLNRTLTATSLSGVGADGSAVEAGTYRITWDVGVDYQNFHTKDFTVDVTATVVEEEEKPLKDGLYLVIDLSGGVNAASYPVSYLDDVPSGGWTDEYKTTKLVLRKIPAGTFMMGSPEDELGRDSEEVQHQVTISKPFYMGVFEVTQRQYELVMGTRPSYFNNDSYYQARPVEQVSWNDIRGDSSTYNWPSSSDVDPSTFMGKLRSKTGIESFDLPTEAKWEYACRAGTTTALNSGKNLTSIGTCANMAEVGRYWNNGGSGYSESGDASNGTAMVGSYLPNARGLYDMHGNVCEWCLDCSGSYATESETDPVGSASGSFRMRRGGCWYYDAERCRSAGRGRSDQTISIYHSGFRLSCSAEED